MENYDFDYALLEAEQKEEKNRRARKSNFIFDLFFGGAGIGLITASLFFPALPILALVGTASVATGVLNTVITGGLIERSYDKINEQKTIISTLKSLKAGEVKAPSKSIDKFNTTYNLGEMKKTYENTKRLIVNRRKVTILSAVIGIAAMAMAMATPFSALLFAVGAVAGANAIIKEIKDVIPVIKNNKELGNKILKTDIVLYPEKYDNKLPEVKESETKSTKTKKNKKNKGYDYTQVNSQPRAQLKTLTQQTEGAEQVIMPEQTSEVTTSEVKSTEEVAQENKPTNSQQTTFGVDNKTPETEAPKPKTTAEQAGEKQITSKTNKKTKTKPAEKPEPVVDTQTTVELPDQTETELTPHKKLQTLNLDDPNLHL